MLSGGISVGTGTSVGEAGSALVVAETYWMGTEDGGPIGAEPDPRCPSGIMGNSVGDLARVGTRDPVSEGTGNSVGDRPLGVVSCRPSMAPTKGKAGAIASKSSNVGLRAGEVGGKGPVSSSKSSTGEVGAMPPPGEGTGNSVGERPPRAPATGGWYLVGKTCETGNSVGERA